MCGIAGYIGFNNRIELVNIANLKQAFRGPDNQSTWQDDYISIAHQRLSIIDLSDDANQPYVKHEYVIAFNGEIYNYKELKNELENKHNIIFRTTSDTEVVLEMYKTFGIKCLDSLIGMFAFSIYNTISKELILVRDHFGIKPLYYTKSKDTFAFSSELKTLLKIPGFNKKINSKSLASCLNYLWVSGNESIFQGTFKVPPAHYMVLNASGELTIQKYWELKEDVEKSNEESLIIKNLETVLSSSIKRHMVADVPVSSFLSGGLDSSLISVIAKSQYPDLTTYTISAQREDKKAEQMPDDDKYAKLISEKYVIKNHQIKIDSNIINELPFIVKVLDEPIGDPAAIITYLMCKEAKKNGVKVILSGMGADEIFGGYRRQKATVMALKYNSLPSKIKSIISIVVKVLPVKIMGYGFKLGRWAKRFLTFTNLPEHETYMRSYSYYNYSELKTLIKEEHWSGVDDIYKEHEVLFHSKYNNDLINKMCHTDISMFMLGLNLTYTDRASMAASVEVRVPFVDKLVVEEAMSIPGHFKIKKGISKYILKKASENHLPKEIIYRPKASFGAPIRSWISNDLKPMVDDLLSEANVIKRDLLNYSFIKKLIDDDREGHADNAYQIYQLLTLELWCREYLDN